MSRGNGGSERPHSPPRWAFPHTREGTRTEAFHFLHPLNDRKFAVSTSSMFLELLRSVLVSNQHAQ